MTSTVKKCGASRYHEVKGPDGQKKQTKVTVKILCYLPFIKRIQCLYDTSILHHYFIS
jgi:hypothetical protein